MSRDPVHEDRPGGIFIPFDKLLEQMDKKLDSIRDELRAIHDVKLDRTVFEAFQKAYEDRHDRLVQRVATNERALENLPQVIGEFRLTQQTVAELENDKIGRDAVKAQTRYWMAGGGFVGLVVLVDLITRLVALAGGHGF